MFLVNLWVIIMEKLKDIIDYSLSGVSLSWALTDVESCLSILLIILSLINLLYKLGKDIYKAIKNKNFDNIDNLIENTIDEIKDIKEGDINEYK